MELHDFSSEDLAKAQRRLKRKLFSEAQSNANQKPVGMLLGGQPAAGKSALITVLRNQHENLRFVVINGDEYRQYHPRAAEINEEYGQDAPKYTQPFSNTIVEYLKAECLRLRCNFIIEGTMRTYAVIERTANEVRQAGFRCEAHALAIHRQDSLLGVFQRFEGDKQRTGVGRFSPIEVHDEAYRQIPLNLTKAAQEKLFDRIVVYTRQASGQLQIGLDIPDNETVSVNFSAEFERLRQPIFPRPFYHDQWLALNHLARQRGETDESYLAQLAEFVQTFRQ